MRKSISAILYISLLLAGGACKKFVQVQPPSNAIITSEVFADSADATAGITGIYINMWNRGSATMGNSGVDLYAGTSSDEMTGTSTLSFTQEIDQNVITITNPYVASLWTTAYAYIYQANACITGASASTALTSTLRSRVIGEAKFVRAFMDFNLVNLFGAVPLVVSTDFNVTSVQPRTSVDSVYAQILADLQSADSLLSPDPVPITNLRPNRYTVWALLARVYLFRQQWANAETYATKAVNGNFTLLNNLDSVFLNGSREAIWQMPPPAANYETTVGQYIIPYSSGVLPQYIATPQLIAAFEPGDKRRVHWVDSALVGTTTYYYPYKYKLGQDISTTPKEAYMVFRLAEQYLIRAEARAEEGTNLNGAISDLNVIRTRAGLPPTAASTKGAVLSAIQHERQVELCFEWAHRWYDLKRTGAADTVLGPPGNVKPDWTPTAVLYPIPYTQTQNNPFLTQNPGYN
jgi:hypothetical protein